MSAADSERIGSEGPPLDARWAADADRLEQRIDSGELSVHDVEPELRRLLEDQTIEDTDDITA